MTEIKKPAVAGTFYTNNKDELLAQLELFSQNNLKDYDCCSRAVIVPHAGYAYSGQLANNGIQYLDRKAKNVFIFAPTHYLPFEGVALSSYKKWSTPLGGVSVNQDLNSELLSHFEFCNFLDEAFEKEHSVEVQVPFLQKMLPYSKIVPILIGRVSYEKIAKVIEYFWHNEENVFVISSDLSHFYPSYAAKKMDMATAVMIETGKVENFDPEQACGACRVQAIVEFANSKKNSLIRVGLHNSGDVTGDNSRVVGYGSWIMFEGGKHKFLKNCFSNLMLDICKKSILAGFNGEEFKLDYSILPAAFADEGACFVTLEKKGVLRGCIGSIIPSRSLADDLVANARNAAFSDPRFLPLQKDEFDDISISISLLSPLEKLNFDSEENLLNQIVPFVDGIIIKDGYNQATYLPSVWEDLPDKVLFLKSLKQKAGLSTDYFSDTFEAYRYSAEYIKSK